MTELFESKMGPDTGSKRPVVWNPGTRVIQKALDCTESRVAWFRSPLPPPPKLCVRSVLGPNGPLMGRAFGGAVRTPLLSCTGDALSRGVLVHLAGCSPILAYRTPASTYVLTVPCFLRPPCSCAREFRCF